MNGPIPFDGINPQRRIEMGPGMDFDPDMDEDWERETCAHTNPFVRDHIHQSMRTGQCNLTCPRCGSEQTQILQRGKRVGSVIGTLAGVASGIAAGCLRAPVFPYPPLRWMGLVSSAVIGGITGGTAGCASGASLGDMLDERVLSNRRCMGCHKRFTHHGR